MQCFGWPFLRTTNYIPPIIQNIACCSVWHLKTTTHNIVRKFELKPFCFSTLQELKPNNPAKRLAFCAWFKRFIHNHRNVLYTIFFTDEAWFILTGNVNAQNFRAWSSTNPHAYKEISLHLLKIDIWCTISRKEIVRPIFSPKYNYWREIPRDSATIHRIIRTFQASLLVSTRWGTCAHGTNDIWNAAWVFWWSHFSEWFMVSTHSRYDTTEFFLWSYSKNSIYNNNPATLEEPQTTITKQVAQIDTKL